MSQPRPRSTGRDGGSSTPGSAGPRVRVLAVTIIVVAAVAISWWLTRGDEASVAPGPASRVESAGDLEAVSGKGRITAPPWPTPTSVSDRVSAAGLDLGPMGMAEHYHPTLRIVIDGDQVSVPTNIGVDPAGGMSALHTHTSDGQIHVEADRAGQQFTLGQLFTQWDVALGPRNIGGLRAAQGERVVVTVNGTEVAGNPALLLLAPGQEIVLELAT